MKRRIKRLQALVFLFFFMVQFLSDTTWMTVLAETTVTLQDGDTRTITDVSAADTIFNVISGGRLIVADGGQVEGAVNASSVGEVEIQTGGKVSGLISAREWSEITVGGTVSDLSVYGNASVWLNSASVTNLTAHENTPSVSVLGTSTLKTLAIYPEMITSGGDGAKLYVTDTVEFLSAGTAPSNTIIEVTESTQIKNTGGAYADILCGGVTYPVGTAGNTTIRGFYHAQAADEVTLEEDFGYTAPKTVEFTVSNDGLEDVMVEQPFPDGYTVSMMGTQGAVPDYYVVPAGESITVRVTPDTGFDAGEYSETLEMNLLSMRESVASGLNVNVGTLSCNLKFTVRLEPGAGTLQVADSYYGGAYTAVPASSTNGVTDVKIEYKKQGAADSTYTEEKPTQTGKYVARATFPRKGKYAEVVVTKEFQITYLPTPEEPYTISSAKNVGGFHAGSVTIVPANGYLIAAKLDGTYEKSLNYTEDVTAVYLKKADTGEKTDEIKLDAAKEKIDIKKPVITGAEDGSTVYGEDVKITVTDDNLSTVTVNGKGLEVKNGKAVTTLKTENGSVDYVIVAKDKAGNKMKLTVKLASDWVKKGTVPDGSKVKLNKNQAYTLGGGTWKVEGDTTTYVGGNRFYVTGNGSFLFNKQ